jgi:hypothetical protein
MHAVASAAASCSREKKHIATLDIIKQIITATPASEKYGIKKEPHRNLRALKIEPLWVLPQVFALLRLA